MRAHRSLTQDHHSALHSRHEAITFDTSRSLHRCGKRLVCSGNHWSGEKPQPGHLRSRGAGAAPVSSGDAGRGRHHQRGEWVERPGVRQFFWNDGPCLQPRSNWRRNFRPRRHHLHPQRSHRDNARGVWNRQWDHRHCWCLLLSFRHPRRRPWPQHPCLRGP